MFKGPVPFKGPVDYCTLEAGIAQLGEQQTEVSDVFWRSRVQSTVLAFFSFVVLLLIIQTKRMVLRIFGGLGNHFATRSL